MALVFLYFSNLASAATFAKKLVPPCSSDMISSIRSCQSSVFFNDASTISQLSMYRLFRLPAAHPLIRRCEREFAGDRHKMACMFKYAGFDPASFEAACVASALDQMPYVRRRAQGFEIRCPVKRKPLDFTSLPLSEDQENLAKYKLAFSTAVMKPFEISHLDFLALQYKMTKLEATLRANTNLGVDADLMEDEDWSEQIDDPSGTSQVFNQQGVLDFFSDIKKRLGQGASVEFFAAPIINGVECEIIYEDGFMVEAFAHGLSSKVINITNILKSIQSVPATISRTEKTKVFCCLCISRKDFSDLNIEKRNRGETCWLDSRAPIMHAILFSEEPNKSLELKLQCVISGADKLGSKSKISEIYTYWADQGFQTPQKFNVESTCIGNALSVSNWLKNLHVTPFETLGVKIAINSFQDRQLSSLQGCDFIMPPQFFQTKVERIDFKVLSNGNILATVVTNSLTINNKEVNVFIVNNKTDFENLGICVGDTILVSAVKGMSPKIVCSLQNNDQAQIQEFPTNCPKCKARVSERKTTDDKTIISCSTHLSCREDSVQDFSRFANICALNIQSLTDSVIQELIKNMSLFRVEDIFHLSTADLEAVRFLDRTAINKILDDIKNARETTLARFIYGLNIPSLTYIMAEELAYKAMTLSKMMNMSSEELRQCAYLDSEAITNVLQFFTDTKKRQEVEILIKYIKIAEPDKFVIDLCQKPIDLFREDDYKAVEKRLERATELYDLTDWEFDLLEKRAREVESFHPEWPSEKPARNLQALVSALDPISIRKVYDHQSLKQELEKLPDQDFIVEPKVNGVACSLQYVNGQLIRAWTKNDGVTGIDVTEKIKRAGRIPQKLKEENFTGVIRGELFMSDNDLYKLNKERSRSRLPNYIDTLSIVVSFVNRQTKDLMVDSNIQFFGYALENNTNFQTQILLHIFLRKIGLTCDLTSDFGSKNHFPVFTKFEEVAAYVSDFEKRRAEFSTNIDGMVIKPNYRHVQKNGYVGYKFNSERRSAKLIKLEYKITRGGQLIAIAHVEPTKFSNGRTISRVNVNLSMLDSLDDLSSVSILYSGGIQPTIHSVVSSKKKEDAISIKIPKICPCCETDLEKKKNGAIVCTNKRCSDQNSLDSNNLLHFSKTMRIGSPAIIAQLMQEGLISQPSDLYGLLLEDFRFSSISRDAALKLLTSVEQSKNMPLVRWLLALNIKNMKSLSAHKISQTGSSLAEIYRKNASEFIKKGINRFIARSITMHFSKHKKEIKKIADIQSTGKIAIPNPITNLMAEKRENFLSRQKKLRMMIDSAVIVTDENIRANAKDMEFLIPQKKNDPLNKKFYDNLRKSIKTQEKLIKILKKYRFFVEKQNESIDKKIEAPQVVPQQKVDV